MNDISDQIAAGGVVILPEGDYTLSRSVTPPLNKGLVLRGISASKSRIFFGYGAGICLTGLATRNFNTWDIANLTFDGSASAAQPPQPSTMPAVAALQLTNVTQGRLDRVIFQNFPTSAIKAEVWWDSGVSYCDFANCGSVALQAPAVWLCNDNGKGRNCNNLTFLGGRFEANPWLSLRMGGPVSDATGLPVTNPARSRVNRFLSVKFHTTLPDPTTYDHVWLESVDDNSFNACNFTNCGGSAIVQTDCNDNNFTGSHIGNSRRYGIESHQSTFDVRQHIIWSRIGGINKMGNLFIN